jgi:hemerythrin
MLLHWTKDWSVGVEELDDHHRHMLSLVNKFSIAYDNDTARDVIREIYAELVSYAGYHFGAEEALFTARKYPDAAAHIKQHLEYREQIGRLRKPVMDGDDAAVREVLDLLVRWWPKHLFEWDLKYAKYLKE